MARFQVVFTPLEPIVTMITVASQLSQEHDVDTGEFTPDRRIVPTIIQPNVVIIDPDGIIVNGLKNKDLLSTSVKWYKGSISSANEILASDTDYTIDKTSTDTRGRITVKRNVPTSSPLVLVFAATFTDVVSGSIRRKIDVVDKVTLSSSVKADAASWIDLIAIGGVIFNPFIANPFIKLEAQLKRGEENVSGHYWWYKKGATEVLLGSTYSGYNTDSIKIPTPEIGAKQLYIVKSEYPPATGTRPTNPTASKVVSKTIALATMYPEYTWKLVSEYGTGEHIRIPGNATSIQVSIQFDTVNGTVPNPQDYWTVNWGGGKTGITQTFTMAQIAALSNGEIKPIITEIY